MDKVRYVICRCLKCYRVVTEKQGDQWVVVREEGVFNSVKEAQAHVDKLQKDGHTAYEILR